MLSYTLLPNIMLYFDSHFVFDSPDGSSHTVKVRENITWYLTEKCVITLQMSNIVRYVS